MKQLLKKIGTSESTLITMDYAKQTLVMTLTGVDVLEDATLCGQLFTEDMHIDSAISFHFIHPGIRYGGGERETEELLATLRVPEWTETQKYTMHMALGLTKYTDEIEITADEIKIQLEEPLRAISMEEYGIRCAKNNKKR